jgi:DNA modification methylase
MIKSEDIELGGVCVKVFNDDCLNVLREMPDNSVDSIVTDPPYGISFMAKKWDYDVPSVKVWKEAIRVLKPGGHALIACGTRTQHRMVCNIEDAGFEIRDVVSWIYGSGFPNISKLTRLQGQSEYTQER